MKSPILLMLGLLITLSPAIFAQKTIYIEYDNACMNRYEYRFSSQYQSLGGGFVSYTATNALGVQVIFEIGVENKNITPNKPNGTMQCYNLDFSEKFTTSINDGTLKAFVVKPVEGGYKVSPVGNARYQEINDQQVYYSSDKYKFNYNSQNISHSFELGAGLSEYYVYYYSEQSEQCTKSFTFKIVPKVISDDYVYAVFMPEIGLLEEHKGNKNDDAQDKTMYLYKINGHPVSDYLGAVCEGKSLEDEELAKAKSTTTNYTPTPVQDKLESKGKEDQKHSEVSLEDNTNALADSEGCDLKPEPGKHIVRQGDNLYRISTQYNVSQTDLKRWNKLLSPTIYPCSSIYITEPKGFQEEFVPKSYDDFSEAYTAENSTSFDTNAHYHTVAQGETLSGISQKYGYTVAKIKSINSLENDYITPGQILKVNDCNCPATDEINITADIPSSYDYQLDKGVAQSQDINPTNSTPKATPTTAKTYIVQEDDTLYSIAKKHNTSVKNLIEVNNITNPKQLKIGESIFIK